MCDRQEGAGQTQEGRAGVGDGYGRCAGEEFQWQCCRVED